MTTKSITKPQLNQPNPQLIILYGPPGSGKGTQASILRDEFGYEFLDFGASFREFVKNNENQSSPDYLRSRRVESDLLAGKAILSEDFFYILKHKIQSLIDSKKQFIIDKPGSLEVEPQWLSDLILENKISSEFIHLELDLDLALQRITRRWYLPSSKNPFMTYQDALKQSINNEEPYQRPEDEDPEISKKRITNLYGLNQKILDIYSNKGFKINNINADQPIPTIRNLIQEIISK
jgi:adenylate kinase